MAEHAPSPTTLAHAGRTVTTVDPNEEPLHGRRRLRAERSFQLDEQRHFAVFPAEPHPERAVPEQPDHLQPVQRLSPPEMNGASVMLA